jgi:hypothetical protein
MNAIGYDALTPEALNQGLRDFVGPVYLGADELECGQYSSMGAPALCAAYTFVDTYEGDDSWKAASYDTEGLGLGIG